MAYGQKNYGQIMGINGRYRISEIGCFLTAFSNLIQRLLGENVDPPTLNSIFVQRGTFVDVDDGVRDDLGYGSVATYNGRILVTGSGQGAPHSNNAIVKFIYTSRSSGQRTTHFCLVADAAAGTIVDSWDGVVKSWNVYGGPVQYATYAVNNPAPIAPVTPTAPAANAVEGNFVIVQPGWGLSHVAKAAGFADFGSPARWADIASLNGSADWGAFNRALKATQRVRVHPDAPAPQAAAPTPAPVPQPAPPTPAPEPPKPPDFRESYVQGGGYFRATEDITVTDFDDNEVATLKKGQGVRRAGTFENNGTKYARTQTSVDNKNWFGIPQDKLVPAPDPKQVKPLVAEITQPDDDSDIEELLNDLSLNKEIKDFSKTGREKVVASVGKAEASLAQGFRGLFRHKKK